MRASLLLPVVAALAAWLCLSAGEALAQGGAFFRTKVGSLSVVALSDAQGTMGFDLLKDASAEDLAAARARGGLPADAKGFPSWVNAFVVELPAGPILIDAGNGPGHLLPQSLAAAGISPDEIKIVLLTHYHGDHIGGLITSEGQAFFKNAVVYADAREDDYWTRENPSARAEEALAPYKASGRFKTFMPGDEVVPGAVSVSLRGHTPGHAGFLFDGGGQSLLVWGDIVHVRLVQFDNPKAYLTFDTSPKEAVATREKVLAEAASKNWVVAGAHLPFPALGEISPGQGQGFEYNPVEAK
ncbi:MAG: MBL fold metallo-hydrolase [Deltaproteobacteria bacterium]|jgi:glyoxylase-like metal-dependent hydrolase (beta-lactamase superfamily II)|nr:MBL fold metallo-hydrolase [Deltaproteobacteria bacterium]